MSRRPGPDTGRAYTSARANSDTDYHWIGEMFLGAWRIWNNWALRAGIKAPTFAAIAFSRMLSPDELAKSGLTHSYGWADHAGANEYFMRMFL